VIWWLVGIILYIGVGGAVMMWIQKDNEFRSAEGVDIFAYGSLILWPLMALLWYYLRPPEQIQDLAAAKSHADFKKFMRERRRLDQDLLAKLDKRTTPELPYEIGQGEGYRDHPLEDLIEAGNYQEAMRTANDMLRFAKEQQEHERVAAYQRYIKQIQDKRRDELG
jgi:hypothetical protein